MPTKELPRHTNGMVVEAYDAEKNLILKRVYYSVGGGALQDGDLKDLDKVKCVGAVTIETAIITSHMTDTDEKSGIPTAEKSSPIRTSHTFQTLRNGVLQMIRPSMSLSTNSMNLPSRTIWHTVGTP